MIMQEIIFAGITATDKYLKDIYGLTRTESVAGIPVFMNQKGEYFVGGYKNLYTTLLGDTVETLKSLEQWRKGKKTVHYVFSTKENIFQSNRLQHILELPRGMLAEERLALYARNVRKHIRRVESSHLRYDVEQPPAGWYDLYCRSIKRKGSVPRPLDWFTRFEQYFGTHIISTVAYDGDILVGVLYCFWVGDYMQLMVLASDEKYRESRLDNGLYDKAILFAFEKDIRFIDFGPTMLADESHWLVKEGFGAQRRYFADISFGSPLFNLKRKMTVYTQRARSYIKKLL